MENNNYEYIDLPSQGLCYHKDSPLRDGRIALYYLTASDENILFNEMFHSNDEVLKSLIKRKIVDENIVFEDICKGDLDAIVVWLRRTGYGNDLSVEIDKEDEVVTATASLNELKNKEFDLIDDGDGNFMYFLENGDKSMFRILGYYKKKEIYENCVKTDEKTVINALLTESVVSVMNHEDKCFIREFIENMDFKVKLLWWLYITDNEPSLDNKMTLYDDNDTKTTILLQITPDILIK